MIYYYFIPYLRCSNMILSQKMLKKILAISVSTRQNNNRQSKHWLIKLVTLDFAGFAICLALTA